MGYLQANQLAGLGAGYVSKAGMTQAQQTAERNRQIQAERQAKANAYERAIAPVRARNEARLAAAKEASRLRVEANRARREQNRLNLQSRAKQQDASRGGYTPAPQTATPTSTPNPTEYSYTDPRTGKTTYGSSYSELASNLRVESRQREYAFLDREKLLQQLSQTGSIFDSLNLPSVAEITSFSEDVPKVVNSIPLPSWQNLTAPVNQPAAPSIMLTTPLPQMSQTPAYIFDKPVGGLYTGQSIRGPQGRAGSTAKQTGSSGSQYVNRVGF